MKNLLCFFCLLLLFVEIAFSQNYTVNELKEDLQILKYNLETVHAGLYTYTDKSKMDKVFDVIEASIDRPATSIEFYRNLIPLLQYIKNGHTNIMPHLAYEKAINDSLRLFPFDIYIDNDSLYVLQNNSNNSTIKEGSFIKTINGEDAANIFKELVHKSSRDGNNKTFPQKVVTSKFNKLYAQLNQAPQDYKLDLITLENKNISLMIKALTLKEIRENKLKKYQDDDKWWGETDDPVLNLKLEDDIATMRIQTFSVYYARRVDQKFKKFFNEAFQKINEANIKHLIIDLRGNGGGDEMPVIELLSHLLNNPFTFYKDMYTITNKLPNIELYNESNFWMNFWYPLFSLKRKGDVYRIKGIPGMKEVKPSKLAYKEKIYVLTDGFSFSATGEFVSFLKNAGRATFIGEEVGGNTNQNVSGTTVILTLPNSKIRIRIPMELFLLNVDYQDTTHGVQPDYYIRPTIKDKLENNDPEMEFTLNLIRNAYKNVH